MNPDKKNIPFFLHPMGFIECFTKLGADQNALLKAANLDQNIFSEQSLLISSKQQIALLHYGINTLQQEYLGFEVGLNFPWCYYGPLAGIVDTSPSLREAGAAFRRYAAIAQPNLKTLLADVNYYIGPEGDMVVPITPAMPENIDDPIRKFDLEFRTAITLRLFNTSGFQPERPAMDVMLQNKVALPISIVERLPVKNIFYESTKNAVSADPKFFATEWRQGRRSLFNDVISRCEQMYHNHGLYDSFTETIRWHIGARFLRSITVEQIASSLHMSPRSLARKLAEEGTNFKELVHVSKMNISLNHLRNTELSVDEVSSIVGFSSKSSFMRAIKNWSGLTIGEIRSLPHLTADELIKNHQKKNNAPESTLDPLSKSNNDIAHFQESRIQCDH